MRPEELAQPIALLVQQGGLEGCALVDSVTGLVWHAHGGMPNAEVAWEAAVDYWRLYQRQKQHFRAFGPLGAAVMYHHAGVLAVLPCCDDPPLVIVAHASHRKVDWIGCQRSARAIGALVRARSGVAAVAAP